jgi:UDP-N-acetylglucosamine 4-epimerase
MYQTKYHTGNLAQFKFLITGGAGFIGSNLVEYLLKFGAAKVRVLDNFSTGFHDNLAEFKNNPAFELIEGDIRDADICKQAVSGMHYVSHQAALGSIPRSIDDPVTTNEVNISGFLNVLNAVKDSDDVKRFVYACSSSTYGDSKELPKREEVIGKPLSPYALTKFVNELYADVFAKTYGIKTIGLRYFNIFGPRQSPKGAYAAVVPLFVEAVKQGQPAKMNGDGEQTRDFTFVENAVQANIKAFFAENEAALNQVYNIACGEKTSLNQLLDKISQHTGKPALANYAASRKGDVRDSQADISKAQNLLGYQPLFNVDEGIKVTIGN